jgi:hypothetical protein
LFHSGILIGLGVALGLLARVIFGIPDELINSDRTFQRPLVEEATDSRPDQPIRKGEFDFPLQGR